MKLSSTLQRFISLVFLVARFGEYAHAQRLIVVGWNIESGGATDAAIAQRVRRFQGVDIWGLAEVGNDTTLQAFEIAAEYGENADFRRILSTTGCGGRLGIVYNATRLQLIGSQELRRVTYNADTPPAGRCQRSPLVAELWLAHLSPGRDVERSGDGIACANSIATRLFTAWAISRLSPDLSRKWRKPSVLMSPILFRHFFSGSLAFVSLILT